MQNPDSLKILRNGSILSLLACAGYAVAFGGIPARSFDTQSYLQFAESVLNGNIPPVHWRTIGFPLFLILTGSVPVPGWGFVATSLIMHSVSVVLLALLLYEGGVPQKLVYGFMITAFLPPYVESAFMVLTETLTAFLFVALLWCVYEGMKRESILPFIAAGAIAGYTALVRPANQLLGLCVALVLPIASYLLKDTRSMRRAVFARSAVMVAISFLIVAGMSAYNYSRSGYFGLSTLGGFALSLKTVKVLELLPAEYEPARSVLIASRDGYLIKSGSSHTGYAYVNELEPALSKATGLYGPVLSSYMSRLNLYLVVHAPLTVFSEVVHGVAGFWMPNAGNIASFRQQGLQGVWVVFQVLLNMLFFLVFFLFIWYQIVSRLLTRRMWRDDAPSRPQSFIRHAAFGMVLYTMGIMALFATPDSRYRKPVDLLILFLCMYGIDYFARVKSAGLSAVPAP